MVQLMPPVAFSVTQPPELVTFLVKQCEGLPNLRLLATSCVSSEPRPLPSTGVTRLHRYYGPLRHPSAPGPFLAGVQLIIPDHAGRASRVAYASLVYMPPPLPRRGSWVPHLLSSPAVSAFPERVIRSARASSVSRFAQRSLTLQPAHSRCHLKLWLAFRRLQPFRCLHSCSGCFRLEHLRRAGLSPTGKRRLFTAPTLLGHSQFPGPVIQGSRSGRSRLYRIRKTAWFVDLVIPVCTYSLRNYP